MSNSICSSFLRLRLWFQLQLQSHLHTNMNTEAKNCYLPFLSMEIRLSALWTLSLSLSHSFYHGKFTITFKIVLMKHSILLLWNSTRKRESYLLYPFLKIDRLRIPTSIKLDWEIVLKYEYLTINNITLLQFISSIQFSWHSFSLSNGEQPVSKSKEICMRLSIHVCACWIFKMPLKLKNHTRCPF